jgi:hypothetical protein
MVFKAKRIVSLVIIFSSLCTFLFGADANLTIEGGTIFKKGEEGKVNIRAHVSPITMEEVQGDLYCSWWLTDFAPETSSQYIKLARQAGINLLLNTLSINNKAPAGRHKTTVHFLAKWHDVEIARGQIDVTFTIVDASIDSIEFVSDHQDENGKNVLINIKDKYGKSEADRFEQPEWTKAGRNNPITHTKNLNIKLKVTVIVIPDGLNFIVNGTCQKDYMSYDSNQAISTGAKQTLPVMTSKGILPNKISVLSESTSWSATVAGIPINLGNSGPHEIFVTFDVPSQTSSRNKGITDIYYEWYPVEGWLSEKPLILNVITYKRIKLLCSDYGDDGVAGGENTEEGVAKKLHKWILDKSGIDQRDSNAFTGDQIWGLINRGNGLSGQCTQAAFLMEMGMRLLGVKDAQFAHVKASNKVQVPIEYGVNLPQVKYCHRIDFHGNEWLFMRWDNSELRNYGEGCCIVKGVYYAGFVNVVADSPVDLLRKLTRVMSQYWYYIKRVINPRDPTNYKYSWELCTPQDTP